MTSLTQEEYQKIISNLPHKVRKLLTTICTWTGAIHLALFTTAVSYASLESSLQNVRYKLTGFILPVMAVIGLAGAAISFLIGHENAKKHAIYAVIGCLIGFGAQALVDFISSTVN